MADEPDAPDDTPKDEPFDEERAKAKIAKANSEAQNLRKRLKELEEKAAKLDQLEEAGKTETERLSAAVAAAERKAQEAELRALRLEVATAKGLTAAQARRLVGSTQEELEADADELVATFKSSDEPQVPGRPKEDLRGGGDPDAGPDPDIRAVVDAIPRGI